MKKRIGNVNAAILCGGKSIRMGTDKALLFFEDEYIIVKEFTMLESIFNKVFLISNDKYKFRNIINKKNNIHILEDIYPKTGPLGAIYTALKENTTDYIFISACDMPMIDRNLIQNMYLSIEQNQILVAGYKNNIEPLFGFYHVSCLPIIEHQLKHNCLKIRDIYSKLKTGIYWMDSNEKNAVINLNTPQDFKQWCLNQEKIKK